MATLGDLLRLGRPHFLLGGVAFLALGVALAWRAEAGVPALDAALAQLAVTLTQWGVHYGNEAHDVAADRANAQRTRLAGGTGLIVAGRVREGDARRVSAGLFGAALVAVAALALRAPATLAVSAPMLLLAWGYSAPPLRLSSRGVGGLATGIVVAGLVPGLALVAGNAPLAAWLPLLPLALQVAAFVCVLDLPDADGDAKAGKRTLAVRLGPRATRRAVQAAWLACGLASTAAIARGAPPSFALAGGASFAAAVTLPVLAFRRAWDVMAMTALAIVALQWALTVLWALRLPS